MWIDEPNLHYGISLVIAMFLFLDVLWIFYKWLNIKKSQESVINLKSNNVILLSSLKEMAASNFSADNSEYTEGVFYFDNQKKYGFKNTSILGFIVIRILFLLAVLCSVLMYRSLDEIEAIHFLIALPVSLLFWGMFLSIKIGSIAPQKK